MAPNAIGNPLQDAVGHVSQAHKKPKGVFCTLMIVAKRGRPPEGVDIGDDGSGLSDELPAAQVGLGLGVGQMQDGLVNAPAVACRASDPHPLGTLAKHFREDSWASAEKVQRFHPPRSAAERMILFAERGHSPGHSADSGSR